MYMPMREELLHTVRSAKHEHSRGMPPQEILKYLDTQICNISLLASYIKMLKPISVVLHTFYTMYNCRPDIQGTQHETCCMHAFSYSN